MGSKVPPITPIRRCPLANDRLLNSRYRDGIGRRGRKLFRLPRAGYASRMMRAVQRGVTIRDMTSVPDRARVRLTGISSRAYEHPADRSALVALRKLTGFDTLLRRLFGLFNERAFRLTYLASSVRASERQFPHIYELVRDGAYILDLPDVPDVYVTQSPLVNAMALGRDKPFIVITTGMVNLYDPEELRWVVGHELGHILSGHAVYRTMLLILLRLAARIAWTPISFGIQAIVWGLEEWFRK